MTWRCLNEKNCQFGFLFVVILVCMLVAFGLIIFYNNKNYKTKITEVLMHDIVIVDINAML